MKVEVNCVLWKCPLVIEFLIKYLEEYTVLGRRVRSRGSAWMEKVEVNCWLAERQEGSVFQWQSQVQVVKQRSAKADLWPVHLLIRKRLELERGSSTVRNPFTLTPTYWHLRGWKLSIRGQTKTISVPAIHVAFLVRAQRCHLCKSSQGVGGVVSRWMGLAVF